MAKQTNIVPLSSGFMLTSIVGFLISVFFLFDLGEPHAGETYTFVQQWGFAFTIFFAVMVVASLISMTYATTPPKKI